MVRRVDKSTRHAPLHPPKERKETSKRDTKVKEAVAVQVSKSDQTKHESSSRKLQAKQQIRENDKTELTSEESELIEDIETKIVMMEYDYDRSKSMKVNNLYISEFLKRLPQLKQYARQLNTTKHEMSEGKISQSEHDDISAKLRKLHKEVDHFLRVHEEDFARLKRLDNKFGGKI